MPGYRIHDLTTTIGASLIFIGGFYLQEMPKFSIAAVGVLFCGFLCNGDLDTNSRIHSRWMYLKCYWYPYKKFMRHRSLLSHGPILGTLIRLIYLLPLLLPFLLLYSFLVGFRGDEFDFLLSFIIGCEIGQLIHTSMDSLIRN